MDLSGLLFPIRQSSDVCGCLSRSQKVLLKERKRGRSRGRKPGFSLNVGAQLALETVLSRAGLSQFSPVFVLHLRSIALSPSCSSQLILLSLVLKIFPNYNSVRLFFKPTAKPPVSYSVLCTSRRSSSRGWQGRAAPEGFFLPLPASGGDCRPRVSLGWGSLPPASAFIFPGAPLCVCGVCGVCVCVCVYVCVCVWGVGVGGCEWVWM